MTEPFQSTKHPELPPDRVRLNLTNPASWRAIRTLAQDYATIDEEFSGELDDRLRALRKEHEEEGTIPQEFSEETKKNHIHMIAGAAAGLGAQGADLELLQRLIAGVVYLVEFHGAGFPTLIEAVKGAHRTGQTKADEAKQAHAVRAMVTAEDATEQKGYPHPGSFVELPDDGGVIFFQFGHPDEVGRNGCYMVDVVKALAEHLRPFTDPGHPMRDHTTNMARVYLLDAVRAMDQRRRDREGRGVHQTDKA